MIFLREGSKPVPKLSAAKLALDLSRVKSSFANLTADNASYVQAAGGPGLFMLEYRNQSGEHFRAAQDDPVAVHPDGTLLAFSSGRISMARAEWFLLRQVVDVFDAFRRSDHWPEFVRWQRLELNCTKYG